VGEGVIRGALGGPGSDLIPWIYFFVLLYVIKKKKNTHKTFLIGTLYVNKKGVGRIMVIHEEKSLNTDKQSKQVPRMRRVCTSVGRSNHRNKNNALSVERLKAGDFKNSIYLDFRL
jgi:hypothetical protein